MVEDLIDRYYRLWNFWRVSLHVFLIRFVYVLSCMIFVAVILSHVSHLLIFLCHLVFISSSVCSSLWIILSHLRTHMRWADSDIRICRRCVLPFWIAKVCGFLSW
jgi:hypothetical protein